MKEIGGKKSHATVPLTMRENYFWANEPVQLYLFVHSVTLCKKNFPAVQYLPKNCFCAVLHRAEMVLTALKKV